MQPLSLELSPLLRLYSSACAHVQEVTRILGCMFDVADALGALQQALSLQVNRLSGNWSWVLQHMAEPWGQLLSEVLLMSDALVRHLQQPGQESAADLLRQV